MVYTEVKERGKKKYYYRVMSLRKGKKFRKERIYLGVNLSKEEIAEEEKQADKELLVLQNLLTYDEISFLEKLKEDYSKEPKENYQNRYESFCALFTYNTNAIEGNTLTLQETSQLLFEKMTPRKSLREINEALNHKKVFDIILDYKKDLSKNFICKLHELIVKDTLKPELNSQIGKYRTLQVFIRGAEFIPTKPTEVPKEMKSLLFWHSKNKKKLHPLVVSAYFHVNFESIHPFVDGNGRVGRLLMNLILHRNKLPMINIPNTLKYEYYSALRQAQTKMNLRPFIKLMLDLLKDSKIRF